MLNIVICDDNKIYLQAAVSVIQNYFDQRKENVHIFKFTNAHEMKTWFENFDEEIDILVLDICIDEKTNGIDIAKKAHIQNSSTKIIFMTAFLEQAADICETDFTYFVYKRSDWIEKLEKALDKALSQITNDEEKTIAIGTKTVYFDEIICLEAQKKNTVFYLDAKDDITASKGINSFSSSLPQNFYACHRSYIVNLDKIEKLNKSEKTIILKNELIIPIPRAKYKEFSDIYYAYLEKKAMWQ